MIHRRPPSLQRKCRLGAKQHPLLKAHCSTKFLRGCPNQNGHGAKDFIKSPSIKKFSIVKFLGRNLTIERADCNHSPSPIINIRCNSFFLQQLECETNPTVAWPLQWSWLQVIPVAWRTPKSQESNLKQLPVQPKTIPACQSSGAPAFFRIKPPEEILCSGSEPDFTFNQLY